MEISRRIKYEAALCLALLCSLASCSAVEKVAIKEVGAVAAEAVEKKLARGRVLAAAEKLIARESLSLAMTGEQRSVFKAIETVRPGARWKRVVSSDVKDFVRSFEKGARDPELYFKDPKADLEFIARWKMAAKADRVFVIGSGDDAESVMA